MLHDCSRKIMEWGMMTHPGLRLGERNWAISFSLVTLFAESSSWNQRPANQVWARE
jgi:hypothetical protein